MLEIVICLAVGIAVLLLWKFIFDKESEVESMTSSAGSIGQSVRVFSEKGREFRDVDFVTIKCLDGSVVADIGIGEHTLCNVPVKWMKSEELEVVVEDGSIFDVESMLKV